MVIKIMINARDTIFFTKKFTNCQCGKWLLINEKVMLVVGLDEKSIKSFSQQVNNNQKKML